MSMLIVNETKTVLPGALVSGYWDAPPKNGKIS